MDGWMDGWIDNTLHIVCAVCTYKTPVRVKDPVRVKPTERLQ